MAISAKLTLSLGVGGAFVLVVLVPVLIWISFSATPTTPPVVAPNVELMDAEDLAAEKLRQEILKLSQERRALAVDQARAARFWRIIPTYATFLTAVATVLALFVTVWKQMQETQKHRLEAHKQRQEAMENREREQQAELDSRERERETRDTESRVRMTEQFNSVVRDLGAESASLQASAAASLLTFLGPENEAFHHQVFTIVLANLKADHDESVQRLLGTAFERAIREQDPADLALREGVGLDLGRAKLYRVDLSDLELPGVDIGNADLRVANLSDANLQGARGYGVDLRKARLSRANLHGAGLQASKCQRALFHNADLVDSNLKKSRFDGAEFQQARLQAAHFDDCNLAGAKFEQANVADTWFTGATFDGGAIHSLTKAKGWEKAHFDDIVRERLEALAGSRSRGASTPAEPS